MTPILFASLLVIAISAVVLVARGGPLSGHGKADNESPNASAQSANAQPAESAEEGSSGPFGDIGNIDADRFLQGGAASARVDPGQMTPAEAQAALAALETQRKSWLAVRSVSGRYKCVTEGSYPKTGKTWHTEQTGSLDLVLTPIDRPVGQSWIKASVRLTDDEYGITFVADNTFDTSRSAQWTTDKPELCKTLSEESVQDRFRMIDVTNWLQPMCRMTETWRDADWNKGGGAATKDGYFAFARVLDRTSTAEETSAVFSSEPQYLLHVNYRPDMLFWFSQDRPELRRIDWPQKDARYSFVYQNYAREKGAGIASFPTRFTWTREYQAESAYFGLRESVTVDLTDAKVNERTAGAVASLVPGK